MKKSFRLAPAAAEDIREILEYISSDSAAAARRIRLKLLRACRQLAKNPGMGHKREDLMEDRPLWFWPVGSYVIIYGAERSPIEIIGVAHGSRDIPAFLRRRTL